MLRVILLIQILVASAVCLAQTVPSKQGRSDEVKTAVEQASVRGDVRLSGVLFDMRVFDGKLTSNDDLTFTIDAKRDKRPNFLMAIRYDQVLELHGAGTSISFFPDPETAPYSAWDDLKLVAYGDLLEVDRLDGSGATGVFLRVTDSEIFLVDGNKTRSIKRDEVKRVFLARREQHSLKKAAKGGAKAAGSVRPAQPPSQTIGSRAGTAMVNGVVLAGTTAAGAIQSVVRRSPNDRLLLYAK